MSRHYFIIKIQKKYQPSLFNFLFELPLRMSLIDSYLLPSFSLAVTLEKIALTKKVYSKLNYKSF